MARCEPCPRQSDRSLCSVPQFSLGDIFDKLLPFRAFVLTSVCVISKDICMEYCGTLIAGCLVTLCGS